MVKEKDVESLYKLISFIQGQLKSSKDDLSLARKDMRKITLKDNNILGTLINMDNSIDNLQKALERVADTLRLITNVINEDSKKK
ncbi:hypothetical protein J4440_00050 [Candidatus Woesearchaeota archaeon]|nr:hypothetical protein [Candidatus Woesearchaeota archaeon]